MKNKSTVKKLVGITLWDRVVVALTTHWIPLAFWSIPALVLITGSLYGFWQGEILSGLGLLTVAVIVYIPWYCFWEVLIAIRVRKTDSYRQAKKRLDSFKAILLHAQGCPVYGHKGALITHLNNVLCALRQSEFSVDNTVGRSMAGAFRMEFRVLHDALCVAGVAESTDWNHYGMPKRSS